MTHTHKYNHTHARYSRGRRGPMLDADDDKSVFLLRGWLFWSWLSWDLCCALSHSWDFWCSNAEYHESEYLKSARCQHLEEDHIFPSWSSLPKCFFGFFFFPQRCQETCVFEKIRIVKSSMCFMQYSQRYGGRMVKKQWYSGEKCLFCLLSQLFFCYLIFSAKYLPGWG